MNNKAVIPCKQCHGLVRVPTDQGSIKGICPHCQTKFLWTPDATITKKKCLNCGYERQEKDDKYEIVPSTECPKCGAIYEKVEKIIRECERESTQEKIRLKEEQKMRERELEHEKIRLDAERIAIEHGNPILSEEQLAKYRMDLEERKAAKMEEQQFNVLFNGIKKYLTKGFKGIILNIALKTAIKKALLDVTNHIEAMTKQSGHVSTFGERVKEYICYMPDSADLKAATWEGSFARMIAVRAQSEMPSSPLIQNQNDLTVLVSLIAEWVAAKGGDVTKVYQEFN